MTDSVAPAGTATDPLASAGTVHTTREIEACVELASAVVPAGLCVDLGE